MPSIYVDPWELPDSVVQSRYQKLARRLNDRMRTMEAHGIDNTAVEKYNALVNDLTDKTRSRLPERKKLSASDARSALQRVQDILEMHNSTWKNVKETSLKAMKTMEQRYGIEFKSIQQYQKWANSEHMAKLKRTYGYGAATELASMMTSDDATMKKLANEFLDDDSKTTTEMLKALGFNKPSELLRRSAKWLRLKND